MNGNDWVNRAVEKIRFGPDREAVRRELQAHLEDRQESLEAKGLTAEEADKAAAQAMGDPDALAEELARVHTPYWGWLWRASRWALGLTAFFAFWMLLSGSAEPGAMDYSYLREVYEAGDTYSNLGCAVVAASWTPEGSVSLGQYRFSVRGVWLEHQTNPVYWADGSEGFIERDALVISLRADTWRFWEPCGNMWTSAPLAQILDSSGTEYFLGLIGPGGYLCRGSDQGLFSTWYQLEIFLKEPEDVPDWLKLPVAPNGAGIRIDLRNEVISRW